ncbi:MAG: hypothetical protein ACK525_12700, partial [Microcystis sp.]
ISYQLSVISYQLSVVSYQINLKNPAQKCYDNPSSTSGNLPRQGVFRLETDWVGANANWVGANANWVGANAIRPYKVRRILAINPPKTIQSHNKTVGAHRVRPNTPV